MFDCFVLFNESSAVEDRTKEKVGGVSDGWVLGGPSLFLTLIPGIRKDSLPLEG